MEAGVRIRGRKINNIKYANDITQLAENKKDMLELTKSGKNESEGQSQMKPEEN